MKTNKQIATINFLWIFLLIIPLDKLPAQNQSPYKLNWAYDAPILAGSIGTFIAARIKQKKTIGLSEATINQLDKNDIWSFDRGAVGYHSDIADDWSDAFLASSYLTSIGLTVGAKKVRKNIWPALVITLESYYLNRTITGWFKVSILRNRPIVYDPEVPLELKTQRYARFSFFSGHTSFTSVLYFSSAKIFADHFPNSKWKPYVWGFAATIPALTGYMRVRAGKHFYSDVITGYVSGALFGILVPHFHKQKDTSSKTTSFSVLPISNGMYCALRF